MFLSCHIHVLEWIHTLQLPELKGTPSSRHVTYQKFKWLQWDLSPAPLSCKRTRVQSRCSHLPQVGSEDISFLDKLCLNSKYLICEHNWYLVESKAQGLFKGIEILKICTIVQDIISKADQAVIILHVRLYLVLWY